MDLAGETSAGELEADSKAAVSEQLRQRGLIVLDVSEKTNPFNIEDIFKRWQGVDMRELAVFSRQFATLVASGMPMLRTLHTLEEQTQDDQIREAVAGVRADVEAGSSLEQAMERYPKVFDRLFRAMVRSGEQSGRLDEAMDRIAFQVEKADSLRRQVKSATDVPGTGLRLRGRGPGRDRRLRDPRLRQDLRRTGRRTPRGSRRVAAADPDLRRASDAITGYWFVIIPGPGHPLRRLLQMEEDRPRARGSGTASN